MADLCMCFCICVLFFYQSDAIKEAEICAYFKKFDEAEKIYMEMDRRCVGNEFSSLIVNIDTVHLYSVNYIICQ